MTYSISVAAYTFAGVGKESEILAVTTTLGKSVLRMRCTLANRPSFSLPYYRKLTLVNFLYQLISVKINSSSIDARKYLEVAMCSTLFNELELIHVQAAKIVYRLE